MASVYVYHQAYALYLYIQCNVNVLFCICLKYVDHQAIICTNRNYSRFEYDSISKIYLKPISISIINFVKDSSKNEQIFNFWSSLSEKRFSTKIKMVTMEKAQSCRQKLTEWKSVHFSWNEVDFTENSMPFAEIALTIILLFLWNAFTSNFEN